MSAREISRDYVELNVPGSNPMRAYVSRPAGNAPSPGLIVFQEAFGVNGHIRNVADRFAAEGYIAIAPELFHRTAPPGFEGNYNDFSSVKPHYQTITNDDAEADILATCEWLRSQQDVKDGQISSVGFCMGGRISFLANSVLPLRAAVSFYGGGIAQGLLDRAPKLHGPMLLIWGGLDKNITIEHRKAVVDAPKAQQKPFVNVEFSNANHGFFCDERSAYQPNAAPQSWVLTLEFLRS